MRIHASRKALMLLAVLVLLLGLLLPAGPAPAAEEPPGPQIVSVEPSGESAGEILITGTGFGDSATSCAVAFGETELPASDIVSWSDTEIVCIMPEGMEGGEVEVTVTTPEGESNSVLFMLEGSASAVPGGSILSVTPNQAAQFSLLQLDIRLDTAPGEPAMVQVYLQNETTTIPIGMGTLSGQNVICYAFIIGDPGVYDVVIPIYTVELRIEDGFTITPLCGAGSGSAVLMLGMTMGLLSLAGSGGYLRRRRRKRK